jgi:sugar O-acyltransferase (sialic acid O-acetyltransferase NeuD family)
MKDLAIYGAGGFGKEVACLIKAINQGEKKWNFIGFFDDNISKKDTEDQYGKVIGGINELNSFSSDLAIVISIGIPSAVQKIVSLITNEKVYFPNIISPDTIFLDEATFKIGKGNLMMFQSLISHNITIGDFNLFNCGVSLGHETTMGSFNSMMSYTKISGEVTIGNANYFGVSSVVLQRRIIGNNTTIGTNSVIMRDTRNGSTYLGNPAAELLKPIIKK